MANHGKREATLAQYLEKRQYARRRKASRAQRAHKRDTAEYCKHCHQTRHDHVGRKCLFDVTAFSPLIPRE